MCGAIGLTISNPTSTRGRWNYVHDFIVEAEPLLKVLSEMWSDVQFSQGVRKDA